MKEKNVSQERAISFGTGPCLVVSGPGSGKTYVITNRIYNLITRFDIDPRNILIITFTHAAACEMRERFELLISSKGGRLVNKPIFGTFHSIFYDILRCDFGYSETSLLKDDEALRYVTRALEDNNLSNYINAAKALKLISDFKLAMERDEDYIPEIIDRRKFLVMYDKYERLLYEHRKLDFHDMITKCYELLKQDRKVLTKYQDRFKYILIDEFQDINRSQYDLVKLISKTKNIFVVGDDDQSIYSFRGSMPRVMKDFMNDYNKTTLINLNINYRSRDNIVKLSKAVINHNKKRFKKDLIAFDKNDGYIEVKKFIDSRDEDLYLIDSINKYKKMGYKLSDMAILYRTNQLSYTIINDLEKNNIRYRVKTSNDKHFASKEDDKNIDSINLMTFHLSKGLEFKIVYIVDANDNIVPHKKSIKNDDVETERRLFYVAMTRAKTNLHIFVTNRRFGRVYRTSRFIHEMLGGKNG